VEKHYKVPTGDICVIKSEETGKLMEFVSLADYGQNNNVKADFLGLSRKLENVKHKEMLPLTEKWVITISTQYGCSMGCRFCCVPKVGPGINISYNDMYQQIMQARQLHPEINCKRLNIHFARMGEPTWNNDVLKLSNWLGITKFNETKYGYEIFHPVVSTMMPKTNKKLEEFLLKWALIKNIDFKGNAGLQLSINSTNNIERNEMFNGSSLDIEEVAKIASQLPNPIGRKYTLNFALANYKIDVELLAKLFPPSRFICKLTPMHKTSEAIRNGIKTSGDYTSYQPYEETENKLKKVGFDVLVFIASKEEDEGLITCGNAILSGSKPTVEFKEIK
jgi:23S rRNA (adenine2503-C2)-methyltransferase